MAGRDDVDVIEGDFEELYEDAPCGYLSTRADGMIVQVNRTILALTGYRGEELVGRMRIHDLLPVGDRIFYETHFAPLLAMQAAAREIAVDLKCADGRRLPVLLNAVMRERTRNRPELIWICVFTATDRREYERELLRARQRAERSEAEARELSRTLQKSFVPPELPHIPGMETAGMYRPAGRGDEVGGDFYDMHETVGGWALVFGDVSGKGVEAAVITSLARYTLRTAPIREGSPSAILASLNQVLLNEKTDRFVTAAYAHISPGPQNRFHLTLSLGGHPPPLHISRAGLGAIGRPGTLLGLLDRVDLTDAEVDLLPGDIVVFFTDGVIEARDHDEFFGEERTQEVLIASRDKDAASIATRLMDEILAFQSDLPSDDIAIVVLKVADFLSG